MVDEATEGVLVFDLQLELSDDEIGSEVGDRFGGDGVQVG